jgi:uncharacterized protein YndB with AHSA1/START domain
VAGRSYIGIDLYKRTLVTFLLHVSRFRVPYLGALATVPARGGVRVAFSTPPKTEHKEKLVIDVTQQINAVRRRVGARVLEAGEVRVSTVGQSYDATLEDVWDACTNPERIPRWFLPVSGDLRLGGRYQLEGNAAGTIERCDPPKSFAATWEYGGAISWIEVSLSTDPDGRTRFQLEHLAAADEHWDEFGPGAVGIGWDMAVMGLALHLSSGHPQDPQEVSAWMASDDGKRFLTLSSERWYEANIAAGTDEATARGAADRSTAAYTGAFPVEGATDSEG